jgi:hypothetical protein
MEEDIKILEELKQEYSKGLDRLNDKDLSSCMAEIYKYRKKQVQAIENLIKSNKEKDKIINLMAGAICYEPLPTEKYCVFRDYNCPVVGGNKDCRECVISFFQKESEE